MHTGIDRPGAMSKAFEFIFKSETPGDYLEFGVYQGASLVRALRADYQWRKKYQRQLIGRFVGFDSFEGLPAISSDDRLLNYNIFQEGMFSDVSVEKVCDHILSEGFDLERVQLIRGWFEDTLNDSNISSRFHGNSVAIAHIDCDLRSSASECLRFLDSRLVDGAVVLFDDWFCFRGRIDKGVRAAFDQWIEESNFLASPYFQYSWAGMAFILNRRA